MKRDALIIFPSISIYSTYTYLWWIVMLSIQCGIKEKTLVFLWNALDIYKNSNFLLTFNVGLVLCNILIFILFLFYFYILALCMCIYYTIYTSCMVLESERPIECQIGFKQFYWSFRTQWIEEFQWKHKRIKKKRKKNIHHLTIYTQYDDDVFEALLL